MSFSQSLHDRCGVILPLGATVIALGAAKIIDPYLAYVATSLIIFGLLGLSLDVVWGRGGFLSLAQTAFYGLGGYFGSIVAINLSAVTGHSVLWSLPAGAAFGALIAAALGGMIFYARMGALQSTILSYTFTLLLWSVSQSFKLTVGSAVIGGDNGMSDILGYILGFGQGAEPLGPDAGLMFVIVVAAITYFATQRLMSDTFGKIIDSTSLDIQRTELLGYDVRRYQVLNFAWSGALAGVLFAGWSNYLKPWLGGGAVGGQTTLILGIVLILLVLFLKNGVLGAFGQLWRSKLPDPNDAARDAGAVAINPTEMEAILGEAEAQGWYGETDDRPTDCSSGSAESFPSTMSRSPSLPAHRIR